MNNFNCYIHFPLSGLWMYCKVQGSVSCVIHPLLLGRYARAMKVNKRKNYFIS